jgi:hypothetical protein
MHTEFWWGKLKVRDNLHEPVVREGVILNLIFRKEDGIAWAGFICESMVTVCGLL